MSMVDETPSYFIKEGYIYVHHEGTTYVSGGFRDHEPAYNTKLCPATPYNINYYLQNREVYNYDTNKWETKHTSDYKDAFDNDIFIGSAVILMDCDCTGGFLGYAKGVVCGFTKEYVKINSIHYDRTKKYHIYDNPEIKRAPYRVICIDNL